jgi:cytochrome c2
VSELRGAARADAVIRQRRPGQQPGKAAFAVCSACHSLSGEDNSGLSDARQAQRPSSNPQQQVPGNRMPFPGVPDESKQADIIAYLATF